VNEDEYMRERLLLPYSPDSTSVADMTVREEKQQDIRKEEERDKKFRERQKWLVLLRSIIYTESGAFRVVLNLV
jgi:hypothetical protein